MSEIDSRVQEILSQLKWGDDVEVAPLAGGLSNHAYLLRRDRIAYTLRVFGQASGHFVDRRTEALCHTVFAPLGLAPPLVVQAKDHSYLLTRFIEGQTLTPWDYCQDEVFYAVAASMRKLHESTYRMKRHFDPLVEGRRLLGVALREGAAGFSKLRFMEAYRQVTRLVAKLGLRREDYRPCHLDLVPANVIVTYEGRPRQASALFLDWEYAAMAPCELEFANIFTELQESEATERRLLRLYFQGPVNEAFYARVQTMRCFAAFYWALWCSIQARHRLGGPDYRSFGERYLAGAEDLAKRLGA